MKGPLLFIIMIFLLLDEYMCVVVDVYFNRIGMVFSTEVTKASIVCCFKEKKVGDFLKV